MPNPPAALKPPLADFDGSDEIVRSAVRDVEAGRLNLQPPPNRWSVLQCFAHLAAVNSAIADAMDESLESLPLNGPTADLRPGLIWGLFLKVLEPPVKFRARAPKPVQPSPALDAETVAASFIAAHDRLRALAERCERIDLNRPAFKHPFVPLRISVGAAFLLVAAHDRRHIWQAEQTGNLQ